MLVVLCCAFADEIGVQIEEPFGILHLCVQAIARMFMPRLD
jgi:hypothetical protein